MRQERAQPSRRDVSRRRFLQSLGVGALPSSYVLCRSAQGAVPKSSPSEPLRFVGLFMPHGMAHEYYAPGPGFDLQSPHCLLSPFDDVARFGRSFRNHILPIDGLDLAAGIEVGTVGHDASRVILTGSGATGRNPSLDQFLAVDCRLGVETPVTSLVLGVGNDDTGLGFNLSYSAGGVPVPKMIDPRQVFDELFGQPLTGEQAAALALRRALGKSVLDAHRSETEWLMARVPSTERHKLEQHQTALREVEKRLSPPARQCKAPPRPDGTAFPALRASAGGEPYFDVITEAHFDLVALALGCDLTRFVTVYLGDLTRTRLNVGLPQDIHMDVAHRYDARRGTKPGNPATWDALATQNRYTYGQIAGLLRRLENAGVLENTIVLAQSDMGDTAAHSSRNVPTLLAGGCGGHFQMGRFIDVRSTKSEGQLVPNNRVLVSIAQAFGVAISTFGSSGNPETTHGRFEPLYG